MLKRLLVAAMVVAATASVSTVGAQAKFGVVCKRPVVATGHGLTRRIARRRAIRNWRHKVAVRYGRKYARLRNARSIRHYFLRRHFRWYFRLRARPCRKLGFRTP